MANDEAGEIRAAARLANKGTPEWDVRRWLHRSSHGTLATVNAKEGLEGFPLGSIVPFAVDREGRPLILIAGIAAHTRNLKSDNRASLFVHDPVATGDPQKSWRASLLGRFKQLIPTREYNPESPLPDYAEAIDDRAWDAIMARYTQRVPNAPGYMDTHGFAFWRMEIESVRYIAGFGRICWVEGHAYRDAVSAHAFTDAERGALEHMNDDHVENMREMCRGHYQCDPADVTMVDLGISGCMLETQSPEGLHFFAFDELVEEVGDYKAQIIKVLSAARRARRGEAKRASA